MVAVFTRQDAYLAEIHSELDQIERLKKQELDTVRRHQVAIADALQRHDLLVKKELGLVRKAAEVHPSIVRRAEGVLHNWYTPECSSDCRGCQWCAGGLQVCKVCGAFEGATPTHCPGFQPNSEVMDQIYGGELDYRFGKWINRPSRYSPAFWNLVGTRLGWRGYPKDVGS